MLIPGLEMWEQDFTAEATLVKPYANFKCRICSVTRVLRIDSFRAGVAGKCVCQGGNAARTAVNTYIRKCLSCDKEFKETHRYRRLCACCRRHAEGVEI